MDNLSVHKAPAVREWIEKADAEVLYLPPYSPDLIARRQGCSLPTAGKWRQRFLDGGLDGLLDEPRPGTPRKLSDRQVEQVLRRTLEGQPEAASHWSTRDMAKATGLSQSQGLL
jgi:transposase